MWKSFYFILFLITTSSWTFAQMMPLTNKADVAPAADPDITCTLPEKKKQQPPTTEVTYEKYKNKSVNEIDIKKVLLEPKKYKGQVLSSLVSIEVFAADYTVSFNPPQPESNSGGYIWMKLPKDMEEKYNNAMRAVGEHGLIMIKYYWFGEKYGNGAIQAEGVLLDISIP